MSLQTRLASLITAVGADMKAAIPFYVPLGRYGTLATFTGPRIYFPDTVQLLDASFSLSTAPTGSSAIFDILKNGTTVFSATPSIAASGFVSSGGTLSGTTTFTADTDYLQIKCNQIGSTIAGADLAVLLKMRVS